jgi:hypothetical protein
MDDKNTAFLNMQVFFLDKRYPLKILLIILQESIYQSFS